MRLVREWWQRYVAGEFASPQAIVAAAKDEAAAGSVASTSTEFDRFLGQALGPSTVAKVVARLAQPHKRTDEAHLRNHSRANWQGVHPFLAEWAMRFMVAAERRGILLYCHSALRTRDEQDALVKAGNSFAKWPDAPHCRGAAVDIVHSQFHWQLSVDEWRYLHLLGLDVLRRMNAERPKDSRVQLRWGGDWDGDGDLSDQRLFDPAHWELANWRALPLPPFGDPVRWTPRGFLARYGVPQRSVAED